MPKPAICSRRSTAGSPRALTHKTSKTPGRCSTNWDEVDAMDQGEIAAAVQEFGAAQAREEYFPRAWFDRLALDDAYRILLTLIRRRPGEGARRIGWKVGLTAKAIQQQF